MDEKNILSVTAAFGHDVEYICTNTRFIYFVLNMCIFLWRELCLFLWHVLQTFCYNWAFIARIRSFWQNVVEFDKNGVFFAMDCVILD